MAAPQSGRSRAARGRSQPVVKNDAVGGVKEVNQLQGGRRIQSAGTEKPATRIWVASRGWLSGTGRGLVPDSDAPNLQPQGTLPRSQAYQLEVSTPETSQLTPPCAVREAGFFVFRG
jgi:hypothetical protein